MKRHLLLIVITIAATVSLLGQTAKDDRRTISVSGEAFAYFAPDRASISIGVETDGKTVSEAKQKNDMQVQQLMQAIRSAGIQDKDIRTSGLNIQPIYDYESDDRRLIKYTMRNQVVVTVRDLKKVEDVLNKGLSSGANMLNGVNFYIEDVDKVSDSLRVEAAKDARMKADKVAAALGVTVLKPVSIQVSSSGGYPQPMYKGAMYAERMMSSDASNTDVSSGEIRVDANVSVVFEIE